MTCFWTVHRFPPPTYPLPLDFEDSPGCPGTQTFSCHCLALTVSSLLLTLHFLNRFKGTVPKTKQILTSGKRTREEKIIGMDFSLQFSWTLIHTHWVGFCLFIWRFEHTQIIFVYESYTLFHKWDVRALPQLWNWAFTGIVFCKVIGNCCLPSGILATLFVPTH